MIRVSQGACSITRENAVAVRRTLQGQEREEEEGREYRLAAVRRVHMRHVGKKKRMEGSSKEFTRQVDGVLLNY